MIKIQKHVICYYGIVPTLICYLFRFVTSIYKIIYYGFIVFKKIILILI
jgi:hypothetical protein